jgi:hypothetical protein
MLHVSKHKAWVDEERRGESEVIRKHRSSRKGCQPRNLINQGEQGLQSDSSARGGGSSSHDGE